MTDQQSGQEPKKKAGSIRQYATLGRTKASERPDVQMLSSEKDEPLESPQVQENQRSDVQTLERSEVEALRSQDVETLERSSAKTPKQKRERQTIYLPPELSEWVKIRAIKEKREISEVVADAVARYRSEVD